MKKHESIVKNLESRLLGSNKYDVIKKEYDLSNCRPDLIAVRCYRCKDYVLIFEVKSNMKKKSEDKAKEQLRKAKNHFNCDRVFCFGVYGTKDSYWIKHYGGM